MAKLLANITAFLFFQGPGSVVYADTFLTNLRDTMYLNLGLSSTKDDFVCPGSSAILSHASCQAVYTLYSHCKPVRQEALDRVNGKNGWVDQHNGGTYSLDDDSDPNLLRVTRKTNSSPQYTDKIVLKFSQTTSELCEVSACSESQGMSYLDFSTNYCNSRQLLCGLEDGCSVTGLHLNQKIIKEVFGSCRQHDAAKCMVGSAKSHGSADLRGAEILI